MDKQQPYDFIKDKLEGLSRPDSPRLWQNMSEVLDREMPRPSDWKRFPAWMVSMAFMVPLVSLVAVLAVSLFGLQNQPGAAKSLALLPVEQARQMQSHGAAS